MPATTLVLDIDTSCWNMSGMTRPCVTMRRYSVSAILAASILRAGLEQFGVAEGHMAIGLHLEIGLVEDPDVVGTANRTPLTNSHEWPPSSKEMRLNVTCASTAPFIGNSAR